MLTATYNQPASDWTRAIDDALAEWSKHIVGQAALNISLQFDPEMEFLASCRPIGSVKLGTVKGVSVSLPSAIAKLQGWSGSGADILIIVNPSYAWSFGTAPEPDMYWAPGVMLHELGHGLFAHRIAEATLSPFEIWRQSQRSTMFADSMHFTGSDALMSVTVNKGEAQALTELDFAAAAASGVPLSRASTIYVVPNGKVTGTSKDVAVWMGTFTAFNASISGIKRLQLRGDNPLSTAQANLYKLYRAALGRAPDLAGFRYWLGTGKSLQDCASGISGCTEFAPVMALWPDRSRYVSQLYRNILGREPDASGLNYWVGRTDLNAAGLLANIAVSPENAISVPTFSL